MPVTEQTEPPIVVGTGLGGIPPTGRGLRALRARWRSDALLRHQVLTFAAIGLACTLLYALVYSLLRSWLSPVPSNALALLSTMGANFVGNRTITFRGHTGRLRNQVGGYVVAYLIGFGASSLALVILLDILGHPRGVVDTAAALASGVLATVVRFFLMRYWVFRPLPAHRPHG